jgi:hypothetical protein
MPKYNCLVAVLALGFLLPAPATLAQDATDRALLATFCDAANIKGSTCKRARGYPDQENRVCDVRLSPARHSGKFAGAGRTLLVVTYESECEPHATNFGGAAVFEPAGGAYAFRGFLPGSQTNDCVVLARNEQQDMLVCTTGYMGQGHLESGVAQMVFTQDYSRRISISHDFLMTAEDSSAAYGANVVTCKEPPPKYFGVSKLGAGPRPETVAVSVEYADAATIRAACARGAPKPTETFGTLAPGDAYVLPGKEKSGRFIIDLVTRKVIPAR